MYLYLYDNFLNTPKYHKPLSQIETRLTDLGIGGKICRLSPLKNIENLISDEVRFGVKTIIAVGNDETVSLVINNIIHYDDIVFGIIPVEKNNKIAENFGIREAEEACDIISARRVKKIDLGKVNNTYFISGINIAAESQISLMCENSYNIIPQTPNCLVNIYNLRPVAIGNNEEIGTFNPHDGYLEALVQPMRRLSNTFLSFFNRKEKNANDTVIPFKKLSVLSKKSVTIITDGKKILKPPIDVEVVPNKLRVIVGKMRAF